MLFKKSKNDKSNVHRLLMNLTIKEKVLSEDTSEYIKRDVEYTKMIDAYCKHISSTNQFKKIVRWITFVIFCIILLGTTLFVIVNISIFIARRNTGVKEVCILLASCTTFLGAIFKLPDKMVEFVFNKNEDQYMGYIISHIQEIDKARYADRDINSMKYAKSKEAERTISYPYTQYPEFSEKEQDRAS